MLSKDKEKLLRDFLNSIGKEYTLTVNGYYPTSSGRTYLTARYVVTAPTFETACLMAQRMFHSDNKDSVVTQVI